MPDEKPSPSDVPPIHPDEMVPTAPNQVRPDQSSVVNAPPSQARKTRYAFGPRFLVNYGGPVSIELSPEALYVFNQIMNMTNDEPADIARKAISLYKVALEAHQQGKAVGSVSSPDALDMEFIGF